MSTGAPDTAPLRPLWLAHHYACDVDRCVAVGPLHLCRRCLAMFGGFFPAVAFLLSPWGDGLQLGDVALVLGLSVLAGIEFVQVVRGEKDYDARRVLWLSPPVGVVMAWLGVTGLRDGLGPAHLALGAVASVILAVLLVNGQVVGRATTG